MVSLDLSSMPVPTEDGDPAIVTKPGEAEPGKPDETPAAPVTQPSGDGPTAATPEPKTPDPEPKKEDPAPDPKKPDETPAAPVTPTPAAAAPTLTEFHKHPDWIKMQRKNEELEKQVKDLNEKITKPQQVVVVKSVEDRIQEDLNNGWKPKDQLELVLRTTKYLREEIKASEQKQLQDASVEKKQQQEVRDKINTEINDALTEFGITDTQLQEKVFAQINKWRADGIVQLNPKVAGSIRKTIEMAKNFLDKTPPPVVPTPTPTPDPAPDPKKPANSKISPPGGGGSGKPAGKHSDVVIKGAPRMPLGDLVGELGKQLT